MVSCRRVLLRQEDVQFFKEDRQDDVISDVYLKKVLYHTAPDESSSPTGDVPGANNRSRFYVKRSVSKPVYMSGSLRFAW
jgi:hypothetical protein